MYLPTGCFLQLLHSILLHNRKALTFALISCEDSVLFVEFHFISVRAYLLQLCSAGAWGEEEQNFFIQTSISTLSAATNFTHRAWCVKIFLPHWTTLNPAQPLCRCYCSKVWVWFSRYLVVPQNHLPRLSHGGVPCCLPLPIVPSPSPAKMWNRENEDPPRQLPHLHHLPTFGHGGGCAEKAHGDQYREHSCAGTDAEGSEGGWCLQT